MTTGLEGSAIDRVEELREELGFWIWDFRVTLCFVSNGREKNVFIWDFIK